MRVHVVVSVLVLAASLLVSVSALELAVLVVVILVVLAAEMLNTALEFTVDLVTKEFHPLAKAAKDVSAGAVLVTSIGAVVVGYLILADDLGPLSLTTLETVRSWPGHLTVVAFGLTLFGTLLVKALTRSPRSFYGGMPSGHAAVSFAAWVAASFIAAEAGGRHAGLLSVITLLMALLVCQSRVESGTHGLLEVVAGAVLGSLVTVAVFQLL